MQKIERTESDKWLTHGFIFASCALFLFFAIYPLFLTMLFADYLKNAPKYIVVLIGTIPHQVLMLLGVVFIAKFSKSKASIFEKLHITKFKWYFIPEVIGIEFIVLFLRGVVTLLFTLLLNSLGIVIEEPIITKIVKNCSYFSFCILAIGAVIIAPIAEELIFRRVIFSFLKEKNSTISATIITSALFAIIHFTLVQIPGLFILGIIMQILYIKHKTLVPAIMFHAMHNFTAMTFLLILKIAITEFGFKPPPISFIFF